MRSVKRQPSASNLFGVGIGLDCVYAMGDGMGVGHAQTGLSGDTHQGASLTESNLHEHTRIQNGSSRCESGSSSEHEDKEVTRVVVSEESHNIVDSYQKAAAEAHRRHQVAALPYTAPSPRKRAWSGVPHLG